jgi:sarcosine oxidase subunit beta
VRLLDPRPAGPPGASWASAGGVRSQDRDPREWPLAVEAARRWPGLADELGADCGFRAGGHLHVTEDAATLPALAERVQRERAAGIEVDLVDGDTARAIAPLLSPRVVGGTYSPGDGQASAHLTAEAFRAAAVRLGARFEQHVVRDLEVGSPTVVLAAGAWTPALARTAGAELPITVAALQMLRSDPCEPVLAPTIGSQERPLSFKQLPSGGFYIGGAWPAEAATDGCRVLDESVRGSWQTACELVPALRERRLEESLCGLESFTPDGVPMLGRVPSLPWLYVAAGFCGHGFQLSPAVGRKVADDLLSAA